MYSPGSDIVLKYNCNTLLETGFFEEEKKPVLNALAKGGVLRCDANMPPRFLGRGVL